VAPRDAPQADMGRGYPKRGWPRAAALFLVLLVTSIFRPEVLVGIPFVFLGGALGLRRVSVFLLASLAVGIAAAGGSRDGLWYVERGWAVLVGGCFAALTLRSPAAAFSRRALGAVAGAAALAVPLFVTRSEAWGALDEAVRDRLISGARSAVDNLALIRGGQSLPSTLVTAIYETVETQASVFPALLGISTMCALGVSWWLYVRLALGSDQGVGALRDFRFNDHLVWLFIAGLLLLVGAWGGGLPRIGANAVVFMGALYVLRGAAVILFLSGGLSRLGYLLLGVGMIFVSPLILAGAMVIGIGDTWLDVRGKVGSLAA